MTGAPDVIVKVTVDTRPSHVAFDCADVRFKSVPGDTDLDYWIDPVPGCKSARTVVYVRAPTSASLRMYSRGPRAPKGSSARRVFDEVATFDPGSPLDATRGLRGRARAGIGGAAPGSEGTEGMRCESGESAAASPPGLFEVVDDLDAVVFEGRGALIVNPEYANSTAAAAAAATGDYGRGHFVVAEFATPVTGPFYARASFYDLGYEPGVATEHTLVVQGGDCADLAYVGVTSELANSGQFYVGAPSAENGNPALIPVATVGALACEL